MTSDLACDTLTEPVDGDLLFQKVLDKLFHPCKYCITFNILSAARLTRKHRKETRVKFSAILKFN